MLYLDYVGKMHYILESSYVFILCLMIKTYHEFWQYRLRVGNVVCSLKFRNLKLKGRPSAYLVGNLIQFCLSLITWWLLFQLVDALMGLSSFGLFLQLSVTEMAVSSIVETFVSDV